MNLISLIVGFVKSPAAPGLGIASILLGIAEADQSMLASFLAVVGGTGLIILAWFAQSVKRVMERWLDTQGEKLIDLPSKEQRADIERTRREEKQSLTKTLEDLAFASDEERKESRIFRIELAGQLADHGARIKGLEDHHRRQHENSH